MTTKTRKAIEDSFLKLAGTKPVDKITVKEIVEDCGINRNSFYYHFEDLPDLIEKTLEEQIFLVIEAIPGEPLGQLMGRVFGRLEKDSHILRSVYFSKNRELLEVRLLNLADSVVRHYMNENVFNRYPIKKSDKEAIIRSYKWILVGMVVDWMNNGFKFNLQEEFEKIYSLREECLNLMIERAVKSSGV